jgi:hypothetical protein
MNRAGRKERLTCVRRTWTREQRRHVGNVAWTGAGGDGSAEPDVSLAWGDPLVGFADVWQPTDADQPAEVSLHLAPDTTPAQRTDALDELLNVAPRATIEVARADRTLMEALADRGFARRAVRGSCSCGRTWPIPPTSQHMVRSMAT